MKQPGGRDILVSEAIALGDDDRVRAALEELCAATGMGFAAVARVTEDRWIAAQVLDRIEFGLEPGSELEVKTTICDEIRQSGQEVFIDHVDGDLAWRRHPVPILYGFQSYVSLPLFRADGSFYGTLCAIDPEPRQITGSEILATMRALAVQLSTVLSAENSATSPG